jgi:hypothetical protein
MLTSASVTWAVDSLCGKVLPWRDSTLQRVEQLELKPPTDLRTHSTSRAIQASDGSNAGRHTPKNGPGTAEGGEEHLLPATMYCQWVDKLQTERWGTGNYQASNNEHQLELENWTKIPGQRGSRHESHSSGVKTRASTWHCTGSQTKTVWNDLHESSYTVYLTMTLCDWKCIWIYTEAWTNQW